jgi:sterol desaturase/sphingolipid hydroxylase (fatty acid hydroxylase superfamily)
MPNWFSLAFDFAQSWLFEHAVQPLLFWLGLLTYAEQAYDGIAWLLYGVVQIVLLLAIVAPLERLFPVERWSDRRESRVDIIYTLINRLGLLPLVFFVILRPAFDAFEAALRLRGIMPPNLEDAFPALAELPLASFGLYLLILDFSDYWRHRLQHRLAFWWAFHSLHHSQRQMTFWTDDRNHLLDEAFSWLWFAGTALLVGVPPGQFILLVVIGRLVESLSHANLRLDFGKLGERLLVSPRFHRMHHAVGTGHEGKYQGCNFASLFPIWDILFRTANFELAYHPTGVSDQLQGRDYGRGFWRQQWLTLVRAWQTVRS